MRIAQVAPVEEVVPPRKYGGTELVVKHVSDELVRRGHKVTLFASGDSKTAAELVPLVPEAVRVMTQATGQERVREAWKYIAVSKLLTEIKAMGGFDIIHQHFGHRVAPFEKEFNSPVITTCHIPLDFDYIRLVYGMFKDHYYVTISDAQRKGQPDLNFVGTVYNGIDLTQFTYSEKTDDYFAFLGRMSAAKGPKQAIMAAKKAGVKLKMAAKVDADDRSYFEKEVKPYIDGKQIEYLGEIGSEEKDAFLGRAKGLLALIQWEEPFGLYFVEAMAAGTPVIAVGRGSVPEIVKNGVTGFVTSQETDVEEAAGAITRISKMSPKEYLEMRRACRRHVENNFTIGKMVDGYEAVYKKVIEDYNRKK